MFLKGMDTETTSDGRARIIANEDGYSRVHSFEDIAAFLKGTGRSWPIYETWNLGYDVRAILKWIPSEYWQQLYEGGRVEYNGYALMYIPGKKFSLGYPITYKDGKEFSTPKKADGVPKRRATHKYIRIYDMAAFYGYQGLNDAANQYLGEKKQDYGHWVKFVQTHQNVDEELAYLDKIEADVGLYCIIDAGLTLKLSEFMLNALEEIGANVSNPVSIASIAGKMALSRNGFKSFEEGEEGTFPKDHHLQTEQYTRPTYRGGLFSCVQRGIIDGPIYEYDISSAYPAIQSTLPNWDNGDFITTNNPAEIWGADYGWIMATFDCEYIPFSKLAPQVFDEYEGETGQITHLLGSTNTNFYPSGERTQPITLAEARWMRDKGYPVTVLGGLIWNQTRNDKPKPYAYLQEMFKERMNIIKQNGKEDMRQYAIKILINSTYGKTVQDPDKYGFRTPTVDFAYGSYITALVRLQVAEVAYNHPGKVIEIATDAVYLTELAPELATPDTKTLGTWERTDYIRGLWIGGGVKQLWSMKKGKRVFTTKARGISKSRDLDLEFVLRKHGEETTCVFHKIRPVTLGEVLRAVANPDLFRPELLNTFQDRGRHLTVEMDFKRKWDRSPVDWNDFLDGGPITSRPWTVEELNDGTWRAEMKARLDANAKAKTRR